MTRRFVILVDPMGQTEERRFREYLDQFNGGWWHWIKNAWLLATSDEDVSAIHIRDHLLEISPASKIVVFEFPEDITWATSGTVNAKGRNIYDWLNSTWGKSD